MFDQLKSKSVQILLLLVFLTFVPALNNKFTNWDDNTHIVLNEITQSNDPAVLKKIFTDTVLETYIPLTMLTFTIEYHLFKLNPFFFHFNNVLLHIAIVYLIYVLFLRFKLSKEAAFWAAFIFGLHPIHVESVVWITERKDVLYTLFYLFALHYYLDYIETKNMKKYFFTFGFGLLSILSKPAALTLPLVLVAIDWFYKREWALKILWEKIPFLAYVIPISLITIVPNKGVIAFSFNIMHSICIFFWSLSFYLHKFIFPITLIPAYSVPGPISLLNPVYIFSILIVIAWAILCYIFRQNRLFILGNLMFILTLFYVLRFAYHPLNKGMVADRFIYLPSVGLCLCLGVFIHWLLSLKIHTQTIKSVLIVMLFLLSMKTITQTSIWKDSFTLWNYVIAQKSELYFAYNNRATAYQDLEQYDLAFADYTRAIEIKKEYTLIYSNRLALYRKLKRYDDALKDLDTLESFNKDLATIHFNRAAIYIDQKRIKEAIVELTKTIDELSKNKKLDEHLIDSYMFRALAYKETSEFNLAVKDFKQAAILSPKNFNAFILIAETYKQMDQHQLAIEALNHAMKLNPNDAMTFVLRSKSFNKLGQYAQALDDALTAQKMGHPKLEPYIAKLKSTVTSSTHQKIDQKK